MAGDWKKKARALRRKKQTIEAIAETLGVSKSAVHRAVADMTIDRRAAVNKERAALPAPWVDEARRLFRVGQSAPKIARRLGVCHNTIYRAFDKFGH